MYISEEYSKCEFKMRFFWLISSLDSNNQIVGSQKFNECASKSDSEKQDTRERILDNFKDYMPRSNSIRI